MVRMRRRDVVWVLAVAGVVLVGAVPATAQQELGGGMVGGSENACAGGASRPALFDTDGVPGPSAGD